MLKRFYELRNEIADFMQIKDKPLSELKDPKWICDLAFLVDLTGYLNDLNLKLKTRTWNRIENGTESGVGIKTENTIASKSSMGLGSKSRVHSELDQDH
ncbi:General transcription factor II-I repeat domain-containing protein 2 [Eumeta japonica]|uniref:General transcription factor II-I repeat domain-containing protein 2 n=1 Tax=Eumeta variegata TaxID=151549 RepID=A0A4C1SNZ0_EUMVA|nr:General transcription factor II-I repeat domain-containing protein 2 [Eumeta japonica]